MFKTFRQYVEDQNSVLDNNIVKNPQLLNKPGADPNQKKIIDQAIMTKKKFPNVDLDTAMRAASLTNKKV